MTQRTEVRFKFTNINNSTIFNGARLQYPTSVFNIGGGTTPSYQYVVPKSGVYLIGYSYTKVATTSHLAQTQFNLIRSGTRSIIQRYVLNTDAGDTTCSNFFMYNFMEGDVVSITSSSGQSKMNISSYTGDNTLNSWWGIKLNY